MKKIKIEAWKMNSDTSKVCAERNHQLNIKDAANATKISLRRSVKVETHSIALMNAEVLFRIRNQDQRYGI